MAQTCRVVWTTQDSVGDSLVTDFGLWLMCSGGLGVTAIGRLESALARDSSPKWRGNRSMYTGFNPPTFAGAWNVSPLARVQAEVIFFFCFAVMAFARPHARPLA